MVVELVASRILAPYIGVSLYTWTSIIGVILTGIAIGNYIGGKIADRYPSPLILSALLFLGSLLTIAILPTSRFVASLDLFSNLPIMAAFILKTSFIFFLPALILSMVSPMVIKLTLADLGETGGTVGTIYAFSTAGSILGTFMTGFYLILWLGTQKIIWLVAAVLLLTGVVILFLWKQSPNDRLTVKNLFKWPIALIMIISYIVPFQYRGAWQESYTMESNYFTIRVYDLGSQSQNIKALWLDNFDQSYIIPDQPTALVYEYLWVFEEMLRYVTRENKTPRMLHLGGGGYCFPRYMETVYPGSINEVVEIDPAVTAIAHNLLGLPRKTSIKTYNQDARLYLIRRKSPEKYHVVISDVFNDYSTPYHLSTLEFNRLVKSHMKKDGIYLINVNDYEYSKYTPSFIHTLKQVFSYVYLFNVDEKWKKEADGTPVITSLDRIIVATDRNINLRDYMRFITKNGTVKPSGYPLNSKELREYLDHRKPLLLTDDYAPTDILLAPIFKQNLME